MLPRQASSPRDQRAIARSAAELSACTTRVVRMARMPEEKKATLKAMLEAELDAVLKQRPSLRLVKLADGAKDNWTLLSQALPPGDEILDFYHAAEHLSAALGSASGDGTFAARHQFDLKRHALRHDAKGVEVVIRHLAHLAKKYPSNSRIETEFQYFRNNRARVRTQKPRPRTFPSGPAS